MTRRVLEIVYVVGIAALTTVATWHPNAFRQGAWVAAIVLTLPAFLATLPILFLLAALAWNLTGADSGGVGWPVSATYVLALTVAAVLNVLFWRMVTKTRRARLRAG